MTTPPASHARLAALAVASASALATPFADAQYYQAPPPVAGGQVVVQQQPVYAQPQQQVVYVNPGRFRYGGDLGLGWTFLGPLAGVGVTGSLRLGWQFNDRLAVFYQGDLPIGLASGTYNGRDYGGAAIVLGTGVMGEYTLGDFLSLGLGPSLDYALGSVCQSGSSGGTSCLGAGGVYFGLQARVSLTLFGTTAGENTRRRGFRIGASSHTTFFGDVGVFQAINLHAGYEWF